MDITVTPEAGGKTWHLTDLLGRSMGFIEQDAPRVFIIRPANRAIQTMHSLVRVHPSLNDALEAIETHTHWVCRLAPESKGQP